MNSPLLSICIPTFNRSELVSKLVLDVLNSVNSDRYEICVHVDGSEDNTLDALKEIDDPRLKVGSSPNQGRASAIRSAVSMAVGQFVMVYDDDDWFRSGGLERILADCSQPLEENVVGYIYDMEGEKGECIGAKLPAGKTNFMKIRADHKVRGDKKEVVLANALRSVMNITEEGYRRVPTSLFWSRLALRYDVISYPVMVGGKTYLAGGMSHGIKKLKADNAWPMALLYMTHVRGFFIGRYYNPLFAFRGVVGVLYYMVGSFLNWADRR